MFLGASLQDLGSVGPETLNLIDNEVERLVGDAEARARGRPRPQLEHRRGDRHRAARAGDALRRRARRGALDRPGGDARGAARRAPRTRRHATPSRHHEAAPALAGDGRRAGRARVLDHRAGRRRPPRGRQRDRRPPDQHASRTPAAMLLLGKNGKFPASAIPTVKNASRVGGKTAEQLAGTCPPATVDLGSWCLDTAPYPLTNAAGRQEQLHLGEQSVRGRRRLAAVRLGTARRGRPRQARVDDPRLAADRHDQPRPQPRAAKTNAR